jgi:hypothetical protein
MVNNSKWFIIEYHQMPLKKYQLLSATICTVIPPHLRQLFRILVANQGLNVVLPLFGVITSRKGIIYMYREIRHPVEVVSRASNLLLSQCFHEAHLLK